MLFRENLKKSGKSEQWVDTILRQHSASLTDTLLLTVDDSDQVLWLGKEVP